MERQWSRDGVGAVVQVEIPIRAMLYSTEAVASAS
jgi:hypothetical protein